jgi:hypothetical protein
MANTLNSYVLANGFRNYAAVYTNSSDGTVETNVVKLDPTSAGDMGITIGGTLYYPGIYLKIKRIVYQLQGMTLHIKWDATTPQDLAVLSDEWGEFDWSKFGGMKAPAVAGVTGKILFTTTDNLPVSSYSVEIHCIKGIPQL